MRVSGWLAKNYLIFSLLAVGLVLRLWLSSLAFHDDLIVNSSWGQWIYQNGPKGFYANTIWPFSWPTQPPLISLVYGFNFFLYDKLLMIFSSFGFFIAMHHLGATHFLWFFNFLTWFGNAKYLLTTFKYGELITMKLLPIMADLAIALIIYRIAWPVWKPKAILWLALYLLAPFSFYLSALWGQYDQFSCLFLLLAFLLLRKKDFLFSPTLFLISIELKPTALIFVPFFLYLYFKQRPPVGKILFGFFAALALFILSCLIFTNENLVQFLNDLKRIIFLKSEMRISTNAFNFWRIFIGNRALSDDSVLFLLPTKIWGYLCFLVLNILGWFISRKLTWHNMFSSLFIIGAGSWLFLTNMLDRYFFAGVVSLLILSIWKPSLLKYWLALALVFSLNLYNQWFYPSMALKDWLLWNDALITRVLALVNVVLFLRVAVLLSRKGLENNPDSS